MGILPSCNRNKTMVSVANVCMHRSQFPDAVRRDLLDSLRMRRVNHKFHYDSVKQTQKWLALHQHYSPSRNDPDCTAIYRAAFAAVAANQTSSIVHVVGLGCGGGQKDTELLKQLIAHGKATSYTPCDVSTPMVLVARSTALSVLPEEKCFPLVCDLLSTDDLPAAIEKSSRADCARLITFFGMIPNFEPAQILPKLASLVRADDALLFSANLAPGPDFAAGVQRILPQYDNEPTRDWLMTFLLDLGVERSDGVLRFSIREYPSGSGLKRVEANFHFIDSRTIEIQGEKFAFRAGETIRLFFSYRYTPQLIRSLLREHGIEVKDQWVAKSGEEAVFLCQRF
jgi:L-histidine N-alpha-methyltransferase